MNIPPNAVIWCDAVSNVTFHVGVKGRHDRFCCWFSLEQDAIDECFGTGAYKRAGRLEPGKPVPLASVLEGDAPENDTEKRLDVGGTV